MILQNVSKYQLTWCYMPTVNATLQTYNYIFIALRCFLLEDWGVFTFRVKRFRR